ncbi:MAG TPA: phosphotransferase [Nostocaceae cyanobacterium]|nr:phosphotransferase [Nostocaceae cyanobacterium]
MLLSLSSQNVIQHLQKAGLCSSEDGTVKKTEWVESSYKNQNLLVTLANNCQYLVKQERQDNFDSNSHELFNEWLVHELLQQFPILGNIGAIASTLLHYDQENSLLVRRYLSEYIELEKFYHHHIFPSAIAQAIGTTLAALHRITFQRREYSNFMTTAPDGQFRYNYYNPAQGIGIINSETFAQVPTEALKFYTLYQSYENLEAAIADLAYEWKPCCLTHNDLQLKNILIHSRWQQLDNCLLRLIDWEACGWGDPAFDLGTLLASYLKIWLTSLIVDPALSLSESLDLALIPLEILQPSILALIRAYLSDFPMILKERKNFITSVIQFAGLALINQIKEEVEHDKYFHDNYLCILEIAKNLLTMPEQSIIDIFGITESEILEPIAKLHQLPQPDKEKKLVKLYYQKTRLRGC